MSDQYGEGWNQVPRNQTDKSPEYIEGENDRINEGWRDVGRAAATQSEQSTRSNASAKSNLLGLLAFAILAVIVVLVVWFAKFIGVMPPD